jgi:predicted nucleic acid-binding protein
MYCNYATIRQQATISIRDRKDLYLLSFAETINADYIVSGDNDLLVLQTYAKTRIVSPAQLKLIL